MFIVSELSENDESDGMDSDDSVCICSVGNSTSKVLCAITIYHAMHT